MDKDVRPATAEEAGVAVKVVARFLSNYHEIALDSQGVIELVRAFMSARSVLVKVVEHPRKVIVTSEAGLTVPYVRVFTAEAEDDTRQTNHVSPYKTLVGLIVNANGGSWPTLAMRAFR